MPVPLIVNIQRQKDCFIEYKKKTQEEIVQQCHTPLVKDCYQPGPVECKTEYESMCETRYISSIWYSMDPIIYFLEGRSLSRKTFFT